MMKLKYLFENFDLAKCALERYECDRERLDETLKFFRISSNAVYPYISEGTLCFLRLAPTEEKRLEDVMAEIEYIEYLRRNEFPAMRLIPARDGQSAWLMESQWGRYVVAAFEGVGGVPLEETDFSCDILFEAGRTLGRMHALSQKYHPQMRRPNHEDILMGVRENFEKYGASESLKDALDAISAELRRLPVSPETYGLLHYDFEPDNVFWNAESRSCMVIDFDDSVYGWFALDVEQALDELPEYADREMFMKGYRSAHPFTQEMDSQRKLMRRLIDLRSCARLLHSLSERVEDEPEWMLSLRAKLEAAKQRIELRLTSK